MHYFYALIIGIITYHPMQETQSQAQQCAVVLAFAKQLGEEMKRLADMQPTKVKRKKVLSAAARAMKAVFDAT